MKYLLSLKISKRINLSAVSFTIIFPSFLSVLIGFIIYTDIYINKLYLLFVQFFSLLILSALLLLLSYFSVQYSFEGVLLKANKKLSYHNDTKSNEIAKSFEKEGIIFHTLINSIESTEENILKQRNSYVHVFVSSYSKSMIIGLVTFIIMFSFALFINIFSAKNIFNIYYGDLANIEILLKVFIPYFFTYFIIFYDYRSSIRLAVKTIQKQQLYFN